MERIEQSRAVFGEQLLGVLGLVTALGLGRLVAGVAVALLNDVPFRRAAHGVEEREVLDERWRFRRRRVARHERL